ncbi:hypothetical protein ABXS75_18240 [Roseburia hominis]
MIAENPIQKLNCIDNVEGGKIVIEEQYLRKESCCDVHVLQKLVRIHCVIWDEK